MSEYQCYEFLALDKPLSPRQMRELREISTRAEISPTRFWNEYHWGDLKADAARLLEKYFDAHLYFANWGTTRFMVRIPAKGIDVRLLRRYLPGDRLKRVGVFLTIEFWSDDESCEEEPADPASLAALVPLRALFLQGDLRPAFLSWLASVQRGEVDPTDLMPPVPDGLGSLSPALEELVELLRLDRDLLSVAVEHSSALSFDTKALRAWVKALSEREKTALLVRAAENPEVRIGLEMRSELNSQRLKRATKVRVSQLLDAAGIDPMEQ